MTVLVMSELKASDIARWQDLLTTNSLVPKWQNDFHGERTGGRTKKLEHDFIFLHRGRLQKHLGSFYLFYYPNSQIKNCNCDSQH